VIDIDIIPVTDEPMEGVAFDVKDHARWTGTIWTGTHGEMISSDLHGAEEPTRWMLETPSGGRDRTHMDHGLFTEEEENIPTEAPWHSLT
jgi:hypothetical protein